MDDIKNQVKSKLRTALWCPAWYELDQTLIAGQRSKLCFFEHFPDWARVTHGKSTDQSVDESTGQPVVDCVFYNQLDASEDCWEQEATIAEIFHPQLGLLSKIDTHGLDYIFFPVNGEEVVVDAEEAPGVVVHGNELTHLIDDWSVYVKLVDWELASASSKLTSIDQTQTST